MKRMTWQLKQPKQIQEILQKPFGTTVAFIFWELSPGKAIVADPRLFFLVFNTSVGTDWFYPKTL